MPQDISSAGLGSAPRERPSRDGVGRRLLDALTLRAHALAVALDRVPDEFGDAEPVDERDAAALRREWLRHLRIWADSSPEQVFALKAGGLMLGVALAAVVLAIAVMD